MPEPLRLLVVDDAPEQARTADEFIRSTDAWADANVRIAISYDEALAAFEEQPFDVAFFDYLLGARDGLSLGGADSRQLRSTRAMRCRPAGG